MKLPRLLIANIVTAIAAYGSVMFMWFSLYRLGGTASWELVLLDREKLSGTARSLQDMGDVVAQNMVFSAVLVTLAFSVCLSILIIDRYKRNRGLLTKNAAFATAMASLFLASVLIRAIWYLGYYQPILNGISKIK